MAVAVKHVATPLSFASSILVLDVYEEHHFRENLICICDSSLRVVTDLVFMLFSLVLLFIRSCIYTEIETWA